MAYISKTKKSSGAYVYKVFDDKDKLLSVHHYRDDAINKLNKVNNSNKKKGYAYPVKKTGLMKDTYTVRDKNGKPYYTTNNRDSAIRETNRLNNLYQNENKTKATQESQPTSAPVANPKPQASQPAPAPAKPQAIGSAKPVRSTGRSSRRRGFRTN